MAWEYSEKTKQLFMDAVQGKPGTHLGEIEHPDGEGRHGSIVCGDALKFTFRVERNEDPLRDVIVEAKYLTFGCTSAIAASEALCELIEGKGLTPIEALSVTNQDIVDFLGGLPQQKVHCSVMGAEALEAALMSTTLPLRMPWLGSTPTPKTRMVVPFSIRATRVTILLVPTSNPTTIGSSIIKLLAKIRSVQKLKANKSRLQVSFQNQLRYFLILRHL